MGGEVCCPQRLHRVLKVKVLVAQSCPAPCGLMDSGPPGSSVYGILQARILEWVAIPSASGSSRPRVLLSYKSPYDSCWWTSNSYHWDFLIYHCIHSWRKGYFIQLEGSECKDIIFFIAFSPTDCNSVWSAEYMERVNTCKCIVIGPNCCIFTTWAASNCLTLNRL